MLTDEKHHEVGLRFAQSVLARKTRHFDHAQFRVVAATPFGNVMKQTRDVHQPRLTKFCHHLIGQFMLRDVLIHGESTQIAHDHQNVLINGVNVK